MVGAGASAGSSPMGMAFWRTATIHHLRNQPSIPAIWTPPDPLTQRMIDASSEIKSEDIFLDREIRPGSEEGPTKEIVVCLPGKFARNFLKHALARTLYLAETRGIVLDSYRVFRAFRPSVISDYNHDGLARKFCGPQHAVIEMHGAIHPAYGAPEVGASVSDLRSSDVTLEPDGLIMGLPEEWSDGSLLRRLSWVMSQRYQHVAIIGYSFAKTERGYDDAVTLASFIQRFKHYRGAIFVFGPDPDQLCDILSYALKTNTVFPVKRYWNVLAHAYLETRRNPHRFRSLDRAYGALCDQYGVNHAFPIPPQ